MAPATLTTGSPNLPAVSRAEGQQSVRLRQVRFSIAVLEQLPLEQRLPLLSVLGSVVPLLVLLPTDLLALRSRSRTTGRCTPSRFCGGHRGDPSSLGSPTDDGRGGAANPGSSGC